MLLHELLHKINQEVKANPKILSFEVKIDQYNLPGKEQSECNYFVVCHPLLRGEEGQVDIG